MKERLTILLNALRCGIPVKKKKKGGLIDFSWQEAQIMRALLETQQLFEKWQQFWGEIWCFTVHRNITESCQTGTERN